MMKKVLFYLVVGIIGVLFGWWAKSYYSSLKPGSSPIAQIKPRPLDKYTIENLTKTAIAGSEIKTEETLKEDKDFTSYLFSFQVDGPPGGEAGKKVTGLINIPKGNGPFPVILMFRGYVDQKQYKTGDGTRKAGEYFAKNGFITVAPDFLGYGGSDKEAEDVFESRFQTYTTALTLLKSLPSLENWDKQNIFLWGHSNGGQIALTLLEITGGTYPTTLWAPVSKPFPYSILVYTDEASDSGKFLRHELARFEETYDTDLYSLDKYLDRIRAPIQIHQGTLDDAVPFWWTNGFVKGLKKLNIDVTYHTYPGADHNLSPAWRQVVANDLVFLKRQLTKSQ